MSECATPSAVVSCDDQNFFVFELEAVDGSQPTWRGAQCREKRCNPGDSCEVRQGDVFVEGVCR